MSPQATRLLLFVSAAICIACSPSDRPAAEGWRTVTARDGDTIVVRTIGAPDSVTLRLVPELRIGELEGGEEYAFGQVSAMAPAPAGGVYVWDRLMKSLRQYDSAGRFVLQVGRRGPGPGEYEAIAGMATVDGLLLFWDRGNLHTSVYDSAGTRVGRWKPGVVNETNGVLYPGTGGRVILRQLLVPRVGYEVPSIRSIGYVAYDVEGTPGDTVRDVELVGAEARIRLTRSGRMLLLPHFAGPFRDISPLGYFVLGHGNRYALTLARRDAPPLRIERDVAAVPVGDTERADEEVRITAEMRKYEAGWRWTGARLPTHKPYWHRVQFDADGRLWVERAGASTRVPDAELPVVTDHANMFGMLAPYRWHEPMRYDLFEPDGRFLGTVAQPERSTLLYMRGDTVWGVVRDSLDVPYVTRWRIEPSLRVARIGAGNQR